MGIVFCCHEDYHDEDEKKVIAMQATVPADTEVVKRQIASPTNEWDFCEETMVEETADPSHDPI